jgi:hypothetical protein
MNKKDGNSKLAEINPYVIYNLAYYDLAFIEFFLNNFSCNF